KGSAMTEDAVRSSGRRWLGCSLGVAAVGMLVHLVLTTAVWAQGRGALRANTRNANIGTVRTVQDMLAFDAAHPDTPVAMSPSLPTMNFGPYRAVKAAAAADVGPQAGLAPSPAASPLPGTLTCSGTSFDFNPSIVANEAGTTFVTWSSTDPTNNRNAQVRMGGKLLGDPCLVLSPGNLVFQSTTPLTTNFDAMINHQRWGDYSAVTLDPSDHTTAYGVNETILNPGAGWGSYIFNMHNP